MNYIVKKYNLYFLLPLLFILFLSIFIGFRSVDVGTDTRQYLMLYHSFIFPMHYGFSSIEPGFMFFSGLFNFFKLSGGVFFSCIAFITTLALYLFFIKMSVPLSKMKLLFFSMCFFVCVFFSSWYLTATTNALRQGMAISIIFYALSFLYDRKNYTFIFLALLSCCFHKTNFLLLPFILFLRIVPLRVVVLFFCFSSLFYVVGINEFLVKFFFNFSGFNLYDEIKNYASSWGGGAPWVGFDIRFFAYNVFWFVFPFFLLFFKLITLTERMSFVIKIYCALSVFYFVFGFGAFSNRWAFPSWLFVPILQAFLISNLNWNLIRYGVCIALTGVTIGFFVSGFVFYGLLRV